jgi:hypothetical protein
MQKTISPHLVDQFRAFSPELGGENCPDIRRRIVVAVFGFRNPLLPIGVNGGERSEVELPYHSTRRFRHGFLVQRPGVVAYPTCDKW